MSQVNLDALIPREDLFKVEEDEPIGNSSHVRLSELRLDADLDPRKSYFFKTLRKADFQRETSEWRPERVVGLIKSFIRDDIIPAVILWNWKGTNYIIDGGHRLSAIVSWIVNDYGYGTLSKAYFGEVNITKEQKKNHDKTLELINADIEIGSYETYLHALDNPKTVSPEMLSKARILVGRSIQVQYIKAQKSINIFSASFICEFHSSSRQKFSAPKCPKYIVNSGKSQSRKSFLCSEIRCPKFRSSTFPIYNKVSVPEIL
jgi:hypothetical protein